MTAIHWDDHERWLAGVLGPVDNGAQPASLLLSFTDGVADAVIDSRHEQRHDEVDPLTELAVLSVELDADAAVLALPIRIADVATPDRETVARTWLLTSAVRRGVGVQLRVRQLPVGDVGVASDVDVEMSPVASLLDDAARHRLHEDVLHVLYTACRWGHTLGLPQDDDRLLERAAAGSLDADASRGADAARHRLRRHALELAARHRPLGGWDQVFDRPGVHAATPAGWAPACPL